MILKGMIKLLKEYLRMNNISVADTSALHLELTDVNKYRLDEINKIKEYVKYSSYAAVVGIPVGITGSSLTLIFTIGTGINKSLLKVTKKKKET